MSIEKDLIRAKEESERRYTDFINHLKQYNNNEKYTHLQLQINELKAAIAAKSGEVIIADSLDKKLQMQKLLEAQYARLELLNSTLWLANDILQTDDSFCSKLQNKIDGVSPTDEIDLLIDATAFSTKVIKGEDASQSDIGDRIRQRAELYDNGSLRRRLLGGLLIALAAIMIAATIVLMLKLFPLVAGTFTAGAIWFHMVGSTMGTLAGFAGVLTLATGNRSAGNYYNDLKFFHKIPTSLSTESSSVDKPVEMASQI